MGVFRKQNFYCYAYKNGAKRLVLKVSHHPPISAAHCEGSGWEIEIVGRWKNKFWGKSMEIHPLGETKITFKNNNEIFTFNQVTSCVHGVLSGEKYIEFYGKFDFIIRPVIKLKNPRKTIIA